jgi:LuxR family maltose regulon positive regulatory protein
MVTAQPPSFGALLRRYRLDANLSQEALAERARMSARAISDLERGVRRLPYRDTVRQLGAALVLDATALAALQEAARGPRAPRTPSSDRPEQGTADDPLLETKLALAPARPLLVPRPRLFERVQQALQGPLTLIAAPAGSGKTTLLSAWRATPMGNALSMAWVSLDAADNDPARFWRYVLAALERVAPGSGAPAMALLGPARSGGARESRPIETVLIGLANGLSARAAPLVLALDDYHLIEAPAIHQGIIFLLDHLPPCLHLLLTSRADPPLPLARLRARGGIVELRAGDLRFTPEEAAAFLREVMGLPLSQEDVAALEARTEGWIAGLQLAALALQGRPAEAAASFIEGFGGGNRYVVDYLAEEVLSRQPVAAQDFLLHTCILDRLCAGLCAAMLGEEGPAAEASAQAMLEELERGNVFLIALDDERRWYRYHHLFADALRGRLTASSEPPVALLHRRAGDWLAGQELQHEAIDHLLAAGVFDTAADLIEQVAIPAMMQGAWQTITAWLDTLPSTLVRSRARLCVVRAMLQLDGLTVDRVESYLRDAERALQHARPREDDRNTWGEIAALHALVATLRGDAVAIVDHAREALECLDAANDTLRGIASTCMGAAYIGRGDLPRAEQIFAGTVAEARANGNATLGMATTEDLSYLLRVRGKLDAAIESCEQALAWSAAYNALTHPFNAAVHLSLADLLRERNELAKAARHLDEAFARTTAWNLLISQVSSLFVRARLQGAQGDPVTALATLDEAAQLMSRQTIPGIAPLLDAYRAQLFLAQGRLDGAAELVARAGATTAAPLLALSAQFIIYDYEHLAMAPIQVLIAQGRTSGDTAPLRAAIDLAMQQQQRAEVIGVPWQLIKAITLQALAWQALGEDERACALLQVAIAAAAPERYVRLFADEGAPMAALLATLPVGDDGGEPSSGYVQILLAACREDSSADRTQVSA